MKEYEIINTGKAVLLEKFLKSNDIPINSKIMIYDQEGKYLGTIHSNGNNEDLFKLTGWNYNMGIASKIGTSSPITFRFQD